MAWGVGIAKPNSIAIAVENLTRQGFEPWAPQVREIIVHRGRVKSSPQWMFGRYLFVGLTDRWRSVFGTRGMVGLVMNGDRPAIVSDAEIARLRAHEINGYIELKAAQQYKRGDRVRIMDGEFIGLQATFDEMTTQDRVRVLLDMLGRSVQVSLPVGDVALV